MAKSSMLWFAAIVVTTIVPGSANAMYFKSANDVSEVCSMKGDETAELVCSAYLDGVADSINSNRGKLAGNEICMPDGMTGEKIRAAFSQFLAKHSDFGGAIAASVIAAALDQAYPCNAPAPHT